MTTNLTALTLDSGLTAGAGITIANPTETLMFVKKVALAATTGATQALSWVNPEGATILVHGLAVSVTTASSGACTIDAGVASSGATSADTLIDGASIAAIAVLDNVKNAGTNGASAQLVTSTQYITITTSVATATLVGSAYITYSLA